MSPINTSQGQPLPLQPGEFISASQPNVVSFQVKQVAPPSPLYIQRDDVISVALMSSVTPTDNVTVSGRLLLAAGNMVTFSQTFKTTNRYVILNGTIPLAEGFLLSVAAVSSTAASRGQTFCRVSLQRNSATATGFQAIPLFADYVTTSNVAGWPGGSISSPVSGTGFLQTLTPANPGVGTDFAISANASTRFNLMSICAQLVTSGVAGNRNVTVKIIDSGTGRPSFVGGPTASIPASTTAQVSAEPGSLPSTVVATIVTVGLPGRVTLGTVIAQSLNYQTIGLLGGDQWSNICAIGEEWLDF